MTLSNQIENYKRDKDEIILDPLCFKGEIAMAVTNRGELIPCCRCDNPWNSADPNFKKLLSVSKVSKDNKVDDILKKPEWKEFRKNLKKNIGPPSCVTTCRKEKPEKDIQILKKINTENEEIIQNQKR